MSNLRPATIVYKKAGKSIPKEALLEFLKDTTCVGFAIQGKTDDGTPLLHSEHASSPASIDDLMDIQKDTENDVVIFWFGRGEVSNDDIQPIVYKIDDEDVLACFWEGDFVPDAATMRNDHIVPQIGRNFKMSGGDPEKFFAELSDSLFQKTLMNTASHRGVFCFLPGEGDVVAFGENTLGKEFDWGSTSQVGDFGAPAKATVTQQVVAAATSVKKSFLGRNKPAEQAPAQETITTDAKTGVHTVKSVIENQPKEEPKDKTETSVTNQFNWVTIPTTLNNRQKQEFIKKHRNGELPGGWKKMRRVDSLLPPEQPKVETVVDNKPKDVATPGTKDRKATDVAAHEANLMILGKEEKEKATDFLLLHLDFNSQAMPKPQDLQKMEAKYGSFSKQLGFDSKEMFKWPADRVNELFKRVPKAALLAFFEMRRMAIVNEALTAKDIVDTAPKTEETVKQEAPSAPAKKSFLGRKAA